MKKILQYPLLIMFVLFIGIVSITDCFFANRTFSEMENRYLEKRPVFTMRDLLANKYTIKYEEYINDQFVGRDAWITLKSYAESAVGKIENNGVIYGRDDYLFEKYPAADDKRIEQNVGYIKEFTSMYDIPITFSIIPNSYMVLGEKMPRGSGNLDQYAYISNIYEKITAPNVTKLDLSPALTAQSGEYIYYRTDHHWTSYGAYLAYSAYVENRGLSPVPYDEVEKATVPDFYGTYYSKCKLYSAVPDEITYFPEIPLKSITIDGKPAESLYDAAQFEKRDKYAGLLRGNNGLTVIQSNANRNPVTGHTSRVLLIKDSYSNSLAPLLAYNFDEIYVADLRMMGEKMSELLAKTEFDDVFILYNFMNFASDTNIPKLRY